jgi:rhodanese-related sulfurtransferase
MSTLISCQEVAELMSSAGLYAIFDVRERGEYNKCQIPSTTSLPRSQIEFRINQLVRNPAVPIVVYDDGDTRASLAAKTLAQLGYAQVSILDGGLTAWRKDGRATVSGVNVPSKAFGERVHRERSIPDILPEELKALQARSANLIILDVRTPEEYGRFCIPDGINVPGGDLILWADELKRKPDTTVVVNCAGRTRSIIGTAALRRLGLTNVRALKNGTMGWVLAGMELEKNPALTAPSSPLHSDAQAKSLARQLASEENIPWISPREISSALARIHDGVTYLIDVRSEREYESGHVPGSLSVPGGQAVQRADDFVAVRNAQIIFISNESARAVMTAYWYRQMGFPNVSVLEGGLRAWSKNGENVAKGAMHNEPLGFDASKRAARYVDAQTLHRQNDSSVLIIDVGTSIEFESAHVRGAKWISRGWIDIKLREFFPDQNRPIVLSCPDGRQSTLAAHSLTELDYTNVSVLDGGVCGWSAAGLPMETGLDTCLVEPNDVVLSPSVRGNKEDMQRYLEWELKLDR